LGLRLEQEERALPYDVRVLSANKLRKTNQQFAGRSDNRRIK